MNVTYIRDFDVLQTNVVPVALSMMALSSLIQSTTYDFCHVGIVAALIADSYFAMRYHESSDDIEFSNFELFAQESWTSEAFNRTNHMSIQIFAVAIIFT